MRLGFVGLGRMGGNMVHRILRDSEHEIVAYNRTPPAAEVVAALGAIPTSSLTALVAELEAPRHVWLMVPAGAPTEDSVTALLDLLEPGDLIVDGGNSRWTDTKRRFARAAERGIEFVDVGTSGGVWGLEVGYCMMVGGTATAVARLAPVLGVLAPPEGWDHMGPAGAGHYVKMVHNGIEYGMLQAYAEGFDLLHSSEYADLDLERIARLWNQGSVVRSWLCELAERAFAAEGRDLERLQGWVDDSGEGRWTVEEAIDKSVPAPVITLSLLARFASRRPDAYSDKVIAALRNQFGGHAVRSGEPEA
jgi:6-phosphogluconate dehydrogenase